MPLAFDDDDATFTAALALIDEWEVEMTRSVKRTDSVSPATTDDSDTTRDSWCSSAAPMEIASPTRSHWCNEAKKPTAQQNRRNELVYLRRTVRELEDHLSTLQVTEDDTNKYAKTLTTTTSVDGAWAWQQIASRQRNHRQESERENQRLRSEVEEQLQIAKNMLKMLVCAHHRGDDDSTSSEDEQPRVIGATTMICPVELTEEDQLRIVHDLYDQRDAIFLAPPFVGRPVMQETQLITHPNGETTIHVDSSWVLPFAAEYIANTYWMFLNWKHKPNTSRFKPEGCMDADVLTAAFESSGTTDGQSATCLGRFVARRMRASDEQEPSFVVWHKWSKPIQFSPISMDGVCVHQYSFMRIAWMDQPSTGNRRLSVVQMYQRIHVKYAVAETPTRRRRVGVLTNYYMHNVDAELQWKQRVLENLLLQSTMSNNAKPNFPPWMYRTPVL